MPKTVQIRDIDDDVYEALRHRAAEFGLSVPEYLRQEAQRLASRITMTDWLERTRRRGEPPSSLDAVTALEEIRGSWPE